MMNEIQQLKRDLEDFKAEMRSRQQQRHESFTTKRYKYEVYSAVFFILFMSFVVPFFIALIVNK